jgi:fatty-acyl-CoA synthase
MSRNLPRIATRADVERIEAIPIDALDLPASTYDLLARSAAAFGERTAVRFLPAPDRLDTAIAWTYAELLARVTRAANALASLGVQRTDAVSLLLPNLPEMVEAMWAAEACGIAGPINPLLEADHIAAVMNAAGARVLVTLGPVPGSDIWPKALSVIGRVAGLRSVLVVDAAHALSPADLEALARAHPQLAGGAHDFASFVSAHAGDAFSGHPPLSTETASYFHTGGTTGAPKLAVHTHGMEVVNAWNIGVAADMTPQDVGLCGLPLFHVNAAIVSSLAMFLRGGELLLAGPSGYRDPAVLKNFWSIVERFRVSFFAGVPTIYAALLQVPAAGHDLSSLRAAICGAAPMPVSLIREFESRTGLSILEGWGLTEGTGASVVNPLFGERRVGSVGLRLPHCGLRVVELDSEGRCVRDCDPEEVGVVAISGPTVMPGYKLAEANRSLWVAPGWLNTGDLGRLDRDGYLWLAGRAKDIIIRGGHNIDPALIEGPLQQHPAVQLAAAVGMPDARVGEIPIAFVQLRPGQSATAEEIAAFAAARITERAAIPKRVVIVDHLPLTAVGKIFKPDLRREAIRAALAEALAGIPPGEPALRIDVLPDSRYGDLARIHVGSQPPPAVIAAIAASLEPYTVRWELAED